MAGRADPPLPIEALHGEVDARVAALVRRHRARLRCAVGCASCCVDGVTVFEVEAERIRAECAEVLRQAPHAPGACAFLDARGACRIYAQRPYVCRTQGLPLRWIDFSAPDGAVERRDICPLNEPPGGTDEPIDSLAADDCWELGPFEARLAEAEVARRGAPPRRVRLRDLFAPSGR
jgi:hypothetical protein